MTSQNNTLTSERGSALIVTILLVSVLLMTALILLQRIVPYAKSVRSMHDASLAYYVARGQTDLARYNFLYTSNAGTVGRATQRKNSIVLNTIEYATSAPNADGYALTLPATQRYIIISADTLNPLQIKLFPMDTEAKNFGTSNVNTTYHTLYARNAGGLRFDLRGVDTSSSTNPAFMLTIKSLAPATITVKMQYGLQSGITKTFTALGTIPDNNNNNSYTLNLASITSGNQQNIAQDGTITGTSDVSFSTFLNENNCNDATVCSLSLILNPGGSNPSSIDFQLTSNKQIPDLNAVVIGDGFSGNGLYYQRVVDLIPTSQDI